jgi:hypothetical protein
MNRMMSRAVVAACSTGALLTSAGVAGAIVAVRGAGTVHTEDASANVSRSVTAGGGDVNVNRNVQTSGGDVDVNRNYNYSGGYHGVTYGGYDAWGHPVAAGAAAGVAAGTAVAVGTVVSTLPSSGCEGVALGGVAYQQCGSTFYQPRSAGSQVQYVVVNPP